jgi:hypothetical protein
MGLQAEMEGREEGEGEFPFFQFDFPIAFSKDF